MTTLINDVRYACRQLRKSPGFAIVAVLTLAVGIGATTAIFTLVYDVLLKPLPYAHAGQLVMLQEQVAEFKDIYPTLPMNANHFENWQQHSRSFQSMAVMQPENVPLGAGGHPLQIDVLARHLRHLFGAWCQAPARSWIYSARRRPGQQRVVILMYGLWRTQFHSDPNILGKTITLDGFPPP